MKLFQFYISIVIFGFYCKPKSILLFVKTDHNTLLSTISNLTKLDFVALDITGKNYLSWTLDVEIHLDVMNLGAAIKEGTQASLQDRVKALIFLRHHLHEDLKSEYLTVKDPLTLWNELKERYDHQKIVILSRLDMIGCTKGYKILKQLANITPHYLKLAPRLKLCGEKVT